jgi:hypothetical protein
MHNPDTLPWPSNAPGIRANGERAISNPMLSLTWNKKEKRVWVSACTVTCPEMACTKMEDACIYQVVGDGLSASVQSPSLTPIHVDQTRRWEKNPVPADKSSGLVAALAVSIRTFSPQTVAPLVSNHAPPQFQ